MAENDTVKLLKECDSGSKMAVASFNEVLEKIKDSKLKQLLIESKDHHTKLGNDLHALLSEYQCEDKEPNAMAKSMSWLKTNMKMSMNESDATVADLITDGCDMGIKSLHKYMNQYQAADEKAKDICKRLISIEETLRKDLQEYL